MGTRGAHAARERPYASVWVVYLDTVQGLAIITASHEHLAVGEQRCSVSASRMVQVASARPQTRGKIVDLRVGECCAIRKAAGDKHLAVGEQRGSMFQASSVHEASWHPRSGCRIVYLSARHRARLNAIST